MMSDFLVGFIAIIVILMLCFSCVLAMLYIADREATYKYERCIKEFPNGGYDKAYCWTRYR